MSTYTSEPGTRLAGRYRLVDQVSAGSGWTKWKAIDETLARPVTVLTFADGFPRVPEVITAARAVSRLTDPRLAQVFDVEDADDQAYVVMEWVVGDSLSDLLADGPLEPARAVALMAEASRAMAGAHAAGQAHLRLGPRSLRWTRSGGIKITGLGIDAALAGATLTGMAADDPALTDTRDLARLLYAALTGYWPGDDPGPLPPAPLSDGTYCTPRQVSADVPVAVDVVTSQALLQRPSRHGPAITTPAAFADALASVAPPVPLPEPAPVPRGGRSADRGKGYGQPDAGYPPAAGGTWGGPGMPGGAHQRRYPATERSVATRAVVSLVAVLVLAAVATTAWVISSGNHGPAASLQGGHHPAGHQVSSTAATVVLKPVSAHSFDPYGNDGTNENDARAPLTIDNDPDTFWHTDYYLNYPNFGNLKPGTGLILDMGRQVRLSQVQVTFGSICCTAAQIRIGNDSDQARSTLKSFTTVASSSRAAGGYTFTVSSKATGQYVLIWLTSLPPMQGAPDKYMARVYNIVVRGTAVTGSG
ncbi:MAG: protein kinase family protein [Streptosporangiaceae bacterium]|nr:protein kinase family protein [Streptosporangiaceae bacterium]MBV9856569.1 protein kinase family protein [Streptosporangiaceae bacterium]